MMAYEGSDFEDYRYLYDVPSNEELTEDLKHEDLVDAELKFKFDTARSLKLHSTALDAKPPLIDYIDGDIAAGEKIRQLWRDQNPVLDEQWKPDEGSSLTAQQALRKARVNMQQAPRSTSRLNSQPPRGWNQPQFSNGLTITGWGPRHYTTITGGWERIDARELESLLYDEMIVRTPDFSKPHGKASVGILQLSSGSRLAIQLRTKLGRQFATLIHMQHSSVRLRGSLSLTKYAMPNNGVVHMDLQVVTTKGPHSIARCETNLEDWVLCFYKETP